MRVDSQAANEPAALHGSVQTFCALTQAHAPKAEADADVVAAGVGLCYPVAADDLDEILATWRQFALNVLDQRHG